MSCPLLQESRVKYCGKSACRKMIPIAGNVAQEICSTPRYRGCSVYSPFAENSGGTHCPYLRESAAQSCAAAAVPRFIPCSEPALSRCGSDSYRYCDVYLGAGRTQAALESDASGGGIRVPARLFYTRNHMWLDLAHGGAFHLGVDAFLTRVLGAVERITFLRQTGVHRPSAVLTARGMDLEVIFPAPLLLNASNLYLGASPARVTADPYGLGWLFEGVELPGQPPVTSGLIGGAAAAPWMDREIGRLSAFLAECWVSRRGGHLMNDGGVFNPGVIARLSREEALRLFHEFFWGLGA